MAYDCLVTSLIRADRQLLVITGERHARRTVQISRHRCAALGSQPAGWTLVLFFLPALSSLCVGRSIPYGYCRCFSAAAVCFAHCLIIALYCSFGSQAVRAPDGKWLLYQMARRNCQPDYTWKIPFCNESNKQRLPCPPGAKVAGNTTSELCSVLGARVTTHANCSCWRWPDVASEIACVL